MITIAAIVALWTAGFAALNYRGVRAWRASWEFTRWIPTMVLVFWDFYFVIGVVADPTSHNLWPVELIGITMLSLILLAVIAVAYDARTRWKRRN